MGWLRGHPLKDSFDGCRMASLPSVKVANGRVVPAQRSSIARHGEPGRHSQRTAAVAMFPLIRKHGESGTGSRLIQFGRPKCIAPVAPESAVARCIFLLLVAHAHPPAHLLGIEPCRFSLYRLCEGYILLFEPVHPVHPRVRQGGPLSPALYVLAFEPLLQRLSSDNSIGRFPLPPDDLSIAVPDEATVCTVLDVMEGYCSASGARINRSKSVVMYLNSAPSSPRPVHGLPVQQRLRILGFHFEPDGLTTENWRLAKQKLTDRIQEISASGCPFKARVTIIRSLLFSFLTYVASVMPVATRTKLFLEGLLFRFLWSGSSMHVARPVIKLPRNKGGLGIPDLGIVATALHLTWTRVALESDMLLTRSFASFFLSTRLRLFSPEAFSNSVPQAGTPSPFYAGAAYTLARLREANPGIELDSLELHDLVDLLTPDLPTHCVRYDVPPQS
ncbi:hypothetical protein HPB52_022174 [Rhipicephalus sanguineus]|uniref:Reverse transcriptase domain-containing protein n=1 Tax=Rhipicephalus sanguineus TaxID=34632 RepID=A0A9D4SUY8_RHISA|nr:hypothetical protein HPB52_022174 [Rhipicephalus sanguineus]